MKPNPKKIAIFDIDGTIFRSSLLVELVNAFIERSIFPARAAKGYEKNKARWLDRKGGYDDYIMSVVTVFRKNLKGVTYDKFLGASKDVVAERKNRVYRYTRDLIKELKKKNYWLVAISHSPLAIVGPFARSIGFDKAYGILYELDDKKIFTGGLLYEDIIYDKAKIVQRILEKEPVTLQGSVGVGDTESDIPFLKLVESPICFNPNQNLLNAAKIHGWKVVVERKDVIYEISNGKR
jgi:HAD superfamily hydrolase (TIGR01490 family)